MEWSVDKSHARIGFSATHMGILETQGRFNEFEGKVVNTGAGFEGTTVAFSAKIASINTENERRDNHLKSDVFFYAEAFPELMFSGKIEKAEKGMVLVGEMTIRDITKPIRFDVVHKGVQLRVAMVQRRDSKSWER